MLGSILTSSPLQKMPPPASCRCTCVATTQVATVFLRVVIAWTTSSATTTETRRKTSAACPTAPQPQEVRSMICHLTCSAAGTVSESHAPSVPLSPSQVSPLDAETGTTEHSPCSTTGERGSQKAAESLKFLLLLYWTISISSRSADGCIKGMHVLLGRGRYMKTRREYEMFGF